MPPSRTTDILIVDDKPEKILALEVILADLAPSVSIVRALSGRDALRHLLTRKFAVILLDVNMPGMDGFETASLIRERKVTENTPIIFITAFGDEPLMTQGYNLGAVDYIQTPVVPQVLRTKVQVFVDLARQTEQIAQQAARLQHRAAQLSAMASELAQAEQRERRRLARLLHDHLQQLLVAAKMRLTSMRRSSSQEVSFAQTLGDVDRLLSEAISAARTLTAQLSPPILYDAGLGPALIWLARKMKEEHGLDIQASVDELAEPAQENVRITLFQAARELLFNIVKHAQASEAKVVLEKHPDHDDQVRLTVIDNGVGFDLQALQNATASNASREGFGLFSISERLALLDGRMDITSDSTIGTSIAIVVPLDRASDTNAHSKAGKLADLFDTTVSQRSVKPQLYGSRKLEELDSASPAEESGCDRIRVLLADDHEILRRGMAMLLDQEPGIEVVGEASNGKEAIELLETLRPDVVIMDVTMPVMNGIEATRLISANHPDVVVIGLSMHEEEDMAEKMRAAGAAMYIKKGGPGDALLAAIRANAKVRAT